LSSHLPAGASSENDKEIKRSAAHVLTLNKLSASFRIVTHASSPMKPSTQAQPFLARPSHISACRSWARVTKESMREGGDAGGEGVLDCNSERERLEAAEKLQAPKKLQ
jgi:hypothetical protein